MTLFQKKLLVGLVVMAFISPIGIILPEKFKAGDAWGEWNIDTLKELVGYVPEGLRRLADIWKAPIPDYNLGGENASFAIQIWSYIVSGIIGILLVGFISYILSKIILKNHE
ncbi:MAG: PDGLE domain-containing protein [Dissulfurimicrobium sp.]|uniref:PDGLE domain-containing protein n=1 Tax=Dissulfurimicrobium TaxID=1769732 RepID=UPI001EDA91D3|nr:PDGLE domain-containing protein [Dissulfurimicrobium hydrothermale]UKL13266.1 cobalamin biosynthesis protein [Dissulfurimicrobium hydrothermale]